jgi:hypothetical protein
MKIILSETQYSSLILEQTSGIDDFMRRVIETYPETKDYSDKIKSFIENSGCKKIEVAKFKYPALGLALHNGVLFNETIFKQGLRHFLFVVFHEIAHQYQYKKYGAEKMYEFYNGEINLTEAAQAMKNIEIIADEFATRKIREFDKMGLIKDHIPQQYFPKGVYKNTPIQHFEKLIELSRNEIKKVGYKDFDTISDVFYNMVKVNS